VPIACHVITRGGRPCVDVALNILTSAQDKSKFITESTNCVASIPYVPVLFFLTESHATKAYWGSTGPRWG